MVGELLVPKGDHAYGDMRQFAYVDQVLELAACDGMTAEAHAKRRRGAMT
ncbi:hypothetical protein GCM10010365_47690 [Streptomyces poonensis]|uniref:Uncharacterized protein n=1 Tax=Streptomyces poonensis TaxID=68255 RepID=A0A918PU10_9ACTN|nr:hypothetical protein GCM10010365_47690 [Streptomyces poonensis]GLJ93335.1 hypothetical protein GCM10017589_59470 [Streptomyces poonensis]